MKYLPGLMLLIAVCAMGCGDMNRTGSTTTPTSNTAAPASKTTSPTSTTTTPTTHSAAPTTTSTATSNSTTPAANTGTQGSTLDRNNTGVNARDRNPDAKTPIDQNENKTDIGITANIRKRIVDSNLSTDAQNVKVITQDGRVTLRGPVKSAEEKKAVEEIARAVAGDSQVDSQLEVLNR